MAHNPAVTVKQGSAAAGAAFSPVASDQTVGYGTVTSVLVRDVGRKIFYVDPSAAPFTLLTERAGNMTASNVKFEWYEKELRNKRDAINNGSGHTAGDATIDVDNGSYFQVNDLVIVPRTNEIVHVTSIATNTLTVTRAAAGTSAAALVDNDDLFIIGSAWSEGDNVGIPDEWQEAQKYNYTQIFRRPFGATRTRQNIEGYFGDTRSTLRAEKAIEFALDLERAFLFGSRSENDPGATNQPRRTTGGFTYWATSNIKDAGGTLTEAEMEDWLADVFAHTSSGNSRVLMAAPKVISVIDQLAAGRLQMVPSDKTYGIAVKQWLTSHGTLNIVKHRLLENGVGTGNGYGGWALCVDPKNLKFRPLRNSDTKLLMNRQQPGVDGWVDEYLAEVGLEFHVPVTSGILKNVSA